MSHGRRMYRRLLCRLLSGDMAMVAVVVDVLHLHARYMELFLHMLVSRMG